MRFALYKLMIICFIIVLKALGFSQIRGGSGVSVECINTFSHEFGGTNICRFLGSSLAFI